MLKREKLLLIDDDVSLINRCKDELYDDFVISSAKSAPQARKEFRRFSPELVLLDVHIDRGKGGVKLLEELLEITQLPIVTASDSKDAGIVVQCMRLGAVDFIEKPFDMGSLRERLKKALRENKTSRMALQLEERLEKIEPGVLIGDSPLFDRIKQQIRAVAMDGHTNVLIRGEPGTGKELVARAIHKSGWRRQEPLVTVNIAALAPDVIASELFGHEKGAFTGANERRVGYLEKAKGGVLFLDEIGELSNEAQVKLLRFLQNRTFCRVGSTEEIHIDVQIVMATNRDLEQALRQRQIREDFYYRIKQFEIFVPPLRDRLLDLPLLIEHFLRMFRQQGRSKISEVSKSSMHALQSHSWPGNIRELEAVLERAIIYANLQNHHKVEREDLALPDVGQVYEERIVRIPRNGVDLSEELAICELEYIEAALQMTGGRKIEAGELLGLNDRFALRRRVKNLQSAYPDLIENFSTVERLYGKKRRDDTP